MGSKIGIILFFVLILAILIYAINSGLVGNAFSSLGNALRFPSSTYSRPSVPSSGQTYLNPQPAAGNQQSVTSNQQATNTINPADIPAGFTAAGLSPYFHQVLLGSVSTGAYGQISLYATNLSQGESVDVTGWHIVANRGGEYVPQAVNLYDPSGLTAPSDIIFTQNSQYVNLYSQSGPFNLRLNECIGYIGTANHFNPPLPMNCPAPDRAPLSGFTGACQNFIYSIGSCQVPNLNNPQIPLNDYTCRAYIADNFNYRACFNAHLNDSNFLSKEWRAWMGASPLDPYHDNVYLFDRNGLLVDTYKY
ncbi:MAG: hypothetical protein KGJ13_01830 [Patescibacteria group bacterium]|nr:hypothetical protein [Patescibacteria group bacterium]